jgi:hypothetical protein
MVWGSNMAFVKLAARDIAPLFMAGIWCYLQRDVNSG